MPPHGGLEWALFATAVLSAVTLVALLLLTLHRDKP